jgi:hypothetical protein
MGCDVQCRDFLEDAMNTSIQPSQGGCDVMAQHLHYTTGCDENMTCRCDEIILSSLVMKVFSTRMNTRCYFSMTY